MAKSKQPAKAKPKAKAKAPARGTPKPKAKSKAKQAPRPSPKPKAKPPTKKPAKQPGGKPVQKQAPPPPPLAPEQELGGRDAVHHVLGAKLAAMRGDEVQERAAIASAIDSFMEIAIAEGLPPTASAYEAQCPEFFWEGSGDNPPVYARVPDATHDEIGRWFQFIVEGVRAYDARVGANTSIES